MNDRIFHILFPIFVIVLLSLFIAGVLFGFFEATGLLKAEDSKLGVVFEFSGAAAAFFASLLYLKRWYNSLLNNKFLEKNQNLRMTMDDHITLVANLLAKFIVRSAKNNKDDLKAEYVVAQQMVPSHFRRLDEKWVKRFQDEFKAEILNEVTLDVNLSGWTPQKDPSSVDLVKAL